MEPGDTGQSVDFIVIGSGTGGMTAAALLSQFGRCVLVLEQHHIPGRCTKTFNGQSVAGGRLLQSLTDGREVHRGHCDGQR